MKGKNIMKLELFKALMNYENSLSKLFNDIIIEELDYIKNYGAYNYVRNERNINELSILFINTLETFENIINAYNDITLYENINDNTIIDKVVKLNDKYNAKEFNVVRKYDIDYMTVNEIEDLFNELYEELYNDKQFIDTLEDTIKVINTRLDEED